MKTDNNTINKGGFTLTELLAVILIIVILAMLLHSVATSGLREGKASFVKIFETKSYPTSNAEIQSARTNVVWKLIVLQQVVEHDQVVFDALVLKLKNAPRSNPEEVAACVTLLQQKIQSSNSLENAKSELKHAFHVAYNSGYMYETQILGYSEPPSCGYN